MNKLCLSAVTLILAISGDASPASPQATSATKAATYRYQQRAVLELKDVQKQLVELAEATPAEKFTWRPADGVRSVAEVYLHVAAGNYLLTGLAGAPPKPGFKFQGFEKLTTDKTQVIQRLNDSFQYAEDGIGNLSDEDLLRPLKFLDYDNVGDMVLHIVSHAHEHLGQSIAYARMNGIVPPWTAEGPPRPRAQSAPTQKQ